MSTPRPTTELPDQRAEPPLTAGRIETPIGGMVALVDASGAVACLEFDGPGSLGPAPASETWRGHALVWDDAAVAPVAAEIADYFAGRRKVFNLALSPEGNEFFHEVWGELRKIPYGETISYGELARRVGRPGAARAVGRANGANPIAIVVPCHRVIGADGKLTGYSGGIEIKAALLAHERALTPAGQATLGLGITPGKRFRVS